MHLTIYSGKNDWTKRVKSVKREKHDEKAPHRLLLAYFCTYMYTHPYSYICQNVYIRIDMSGCLKSYTFVHIRYVWRQVSRLQL